MKTKNHIRVHGGKVIPDHVIRKVMVDEPVDTDFKVEGGVRRLLLEPAEGCPDKYVRLEMVPIENVDWTNGMFRRLCIAERDVLGSPALTTFFRECTFIMNAMQDPKTRVWTATRFTPDQYYNLVQRAEKAGFIPQYGKSKWPTGGGRKARSAGKFFFAKEDVTSRLYREVLKVDPEKMIPLKRVSRTSILFQGPLVKFPIEPKIAYTNVPMNGVVLVDPRFAEEIGLRRGDKLWPCKASVEISSLNMNVDMVIPMDSVKFKEHEDPKVLASLMSIVPALSAEARSSKAKNRLPRLALDTAQFLWPHSKPLYETDERLQGTLTKVRNAVEGRATVDEVLDLMKYKDPMGNDAWPMEGRFLKRGQPLQDDRIRKAVFKAAGTHAMDGLRFTIGGNYGVVMPVKALPPSDLKQKEVWLRHNVKDVVVPPWMLPIRAITDGATEHVVGVDSDMLVDGIGKDYDGDLAIVLRIGGLLKKLGLPRDFFLDWTKEEDRKFAKDWIKLPKQTVSDDKSGVHDVMVRGLSCYGMIGRATNAILVVLDGMRRNGMPVRELMGRYLELMSLEVQPFVDGLKYDPKDVAAPSRRALANKHGIDPNIAKNLDDRVNSGRRVVFDALAFLPEDKELEGSFYYGLSRLFAGWKPLPVIDMQAIGRALVEKLQPSERLLRLRRRTFKQFEGIKEPERVEKRFKELEHLLRGVPGSSPDAVIVGLIADCWASRDVTFATFLESRTGIRLVHSPSEPLEVVKGRWGLK